MQNPLELLHPASLKHLSGHLQALISGRLWLKIIIALILGIGVGLVLGPSIGLVSSGAAMVISNWVALPGKVFLSLIQMIVVPLVFASVIRGLASSEDLQQLRKLGLRLVLYFIATTVVAITIGLLVGFLVQPGKYIDSTLIQSTVVSAGSTTGQGTVEPMKVDNIPDIITGILPDNPLGSMVNNEMLQVVLFAVIFGLALVAMPVEQSKPLLDLLGSMQEVCMTVVRWAMVLAPLAVFGLMAQITMKVGLDALLGMAVYVGTVLLAASIGSPGTPGVGIVILSMVLNSVGIPAGGIALIIGVDRILDMSRTALNVTGDMTASLVMNRWLGGDTK